MAAAYFTWTGLLVRFVFAVILVFATYNPTPYSYYDWVFVQAFNDTAAWKEMLPFKVFATLVLLIGWIIYLRASWRSLGPIGLILALAFFVTLVWLLVEYNLLELGSAQVISYVVLMVLSAVLTVGISWSLIRRRLSGQVDVDDVDQQD